MVCTVGGYGGIYVYVFFFLLYIALVSCLCVKAAENTSWKMSMAVASGGIFLPFALFCVLFPGMLFVLAYLVMVVMLATKAGSRGAVARGMVITAVGILLPISLPFAGFLV